ncbi:GNAT family N-acetyltransferase [Staphylococcus edaphicus]|uniref:GNAT family N-acetyltransferase n=1 Tax=Staphylococcus edaphicus TaxID=1955013 RepID=A0A2C6WHS3_9STAP|nr:GNAT family N-acetyltransferase [Staphylococcus edaphicus]PHK50348.1 GNAT family N-acetyltransferase [Staphylococcus edaphicus]UQW82755.1 GNAT family N-acetyltransferase [Staphylococcus edaphicus]
MNDIYQQGTIYQSDNRKTIYLTPEEPLVYDTNKWAYKIMPTIDSWKLDIAYQQYMHEQQSSSHLAFTFPENENLDQQWLDEINALGFELGIMELYAIEPCDINRSKYNDIEVVIVNDMTLEDYIAIYRKFAEPYGVAYANESIQLIRNQFDTENRLRIIAYKDNTPVGILDLIVGETTVEIDGFGVLTQFQRQGIGAVMQSFVAEIANDKTIILIADGEDSAKNMYIKQGYIFISYCYQVLKEHI